MRQNNLFWEKILRKEITQPWGSDRKNITISLFCQNTVRLKKWAEKSKSSRFFGWKEDDLRGILGQAEDKESPSQEGEGRRPLMYCRTKEVLDELRQGPPAEPT